MIYSAGDLGIEIDLGPDTSGMILQRREQDGARVLSPVDIETLPPGYYRQVKSPVSTA